jgi:hypothetical protein
MASIDAAADIAVNGVMVYPESTTGNSDVAGAPIAKYSELRWRSLTPTD